MEQLSIALDWTINTNHSGFIVAKELGFYEDVQLEVNIITPQTDNYTLTPAKKLENGMVDFALCPMESVLSYRTKARPFNAIAIATIFREDLSAIATLTRPDINTPKHLDGKVYASYKAKYEDLIVQQLIENDGGMGQIKINYPDKLGIWNTLLKKEADATWIFENWEGIKAKQAGIALNTFRLKDYGIPYSYSPVIICAESLINKRKKVYAAFLSATKKGFLYAQNNPEATVSILLPNVPEEDKEVAFLLESQTYTAPYYGSENDWGKMDTAKVQTYLNWIYTNDIETKRFSVDEIITNILL